jgi:hypothetical protein
MGVRLPNGKLRGLFRPVEPKPTPLERRRRARDTRLPFDDAVQQLGVPVFDRQAGLSELGTYLAPRR